MTADHFSMQGISPLRYLFGRNDVVLVRLAAGRETHLPRSAEGVGTGIGDLPAGAPCRRDEEHTYHVLPKDKY